MKFAFDDEIYEYMAGMMYRVKRVEKISPPATVRPIEILLSAPAPVAKAIGATPKMVERLVIRIGLNLDAAESIIASNFLSPANFLWLANSTIRIPFLETRPISIIKPI